MPGLNQLKQFASDIQNIGDEVKIRAQRGEKTAVVPLPAGISEEDDSEDFVLGLPEIVQENEAEDSLESVSDEPSDADSVPEIDLNAQDTGAGLPPDLDALLNSVSSGGDGVPDLSDFDDTPPEQPAEPEETPLEDLSLDDLLKPSEPDSSEQEGSVPDFSAEAAAGQTGADSALEALSSIDDFSTMPEAPSQGSSSDFSEALPDFDGDLDSLESLDEIPSGPDASDGVSDAPERSAGAGSDAAGADIASGLDDLADVESLDAPGAGISGAAGDETAGAESAAVEGAGAETAAVEDDFAFDGNAIDLNEDIPEEIAEEDGSMPVEEALPEDNAAEALESAEEAEAALSQEDADEAGAAEPAVADLFSTDDLDTPQEVEAEGDSDTAEGGISAGDFALPDFEASAGETDGAVDSALPDLDTPAGAEALDSLPSEDSALPDFDLPSMDVGETGSGTAADAILNSNAGAVDASLDVPSEDFSGAMADMGEAGDIDFGSSGDVSDEFPVTSAPSEDDFLLDDDNFEIPGFSDTQTAEFDKKGRPKVDTVDFSKAGTAKPKNTLTDDEYKKFRKNLSDYPLNLRLAIEDLIVKNEFTDDAVFEVVEKILKKAPARQVATHLEKMLDISIDVPRDYERRSVAQYEAYKQSFQYQLRNRIIPGGIAGIILTVLCTLLFQAGRAFIYNPAMAKMLYRQGYTLLENNEYPQSEERFIQANKYKSIKKWFFKYAHGYREHKQYERAGQMYRNILGVFDHDKKAGLEWAEMELYERSNYERAEEIVRREVLDYHINDSDGLLLLGDVFLEWGEAEPSKYENAREHYSNLIQLYGATNTYMARMMRYFIRTDKLRNVLELKTRFYPDKKSLIAKDWVELSGYLLDKLYGPLSRSDEYLRSQIEDVRAMLEIAVKADSSDPAAHYNMARYFNHNNNFESARRELKHSLECFDRIKYRTKKNTYQEIDVCRLLGELYADTREYLKAQEIYTRGIDLFQSENERTGFEGDKNTGLLYADMGDIEYFISGDMDAALKNYENSILNKNDTASLNFRIGAIRYNSQEYDKALQSFIKAAETEDKDINLMLSLANVLSLRGDNFAAQGYYSHLLNILNADKARHLMLFPQEREEDNRLVEMFLKVNNNLGVTLYRIARQTGDSAKNAESLVRLSDSIRAWDALTRNPQTMVRLGGSNLALQNSKYITASKADYEPAIYTDIPKTLVDEKILK